MSTPSSEITAPPIPADWWMFCDMRGFSPKTPYYLYTKRCGESVEIVKLSDIEPPTRDFGSEPFKKHKLVPVLLAFHSPQRTLPPIKLQRNEPTHKFPYTVRDGFHRYYASAAVGYAEIPALVFDKEDYEV